MNNGEDKKTAFLIKDQKYPNLSQDYFLLQSVAV
ncbi:hypothetical protein G983_02206 [Escherichia coli UMEA 3656-1]|nr:hypothetical protein G983_02206 [Escherichia coli UMEA 3656-1]